MKLTAYCVTQKKKVNITRIKNIWKIKSRNHFLYLIEGESKECTTSLWRAVSLSDAEELSKQHKIPIRVKPASSKPKKVKRSKSKSAKPKAKKATKSKTKPKEKKAKKSKK
jgi:hypothetical protein